jgi:hypothetical protein
MAEERKMGKYETLSKDYCFHPVAFETFGAIGPQSMRFISSLGHLLNERSSNPREAQFLRQRLAITVQRGNAACVLETFNE